MKAGAKQSLSKTGRAGGLEATRRKRPAQVQGMASEAVLGNCDLLGMPRTAPHKGPSSSEKAEYRA